MKNGIGFLLTIALALSAQADVLRLKKGGSVQGVVVSSDSKEIVFMGANGTEQTYPLTAVSGVTFGPLPPPPAKPVLTIPAGTQITVRMIDSIDGKTATGGATYRASIDDPVGVGSVTAIPDNANCTVEVVSLKSGDEMQLRLREINVRGKSYSVSTEYAQVDATGTSKKKSAVKRGIGLGALGAGIGAIAGGGTGAAIGVLVGGGVGAVSAAGAKGKQLNVPSETRLIFALKAPLPMK